MRFRCQRCLYWSDHPLGLIIDSDGICSGCKVHEEKFYIDWSDRESELRLLLANYIGQSKYDCIVPVSGGQDSFFIVHLVMNRLGLNPLLVNFNRNFNSKEGIKNLALLRTCFDADFRQFTLDPNVARKVISTTLTNLGTINWLWNAGQTSYPVRLAVQLRIPLIIWGAHQGLEQVGMFSHYDNVEMTSRYRKEHDLLGYDENDIFSFNPNFTKDDIQSLSYPTDKDLIENQIRGIYLGNYFKWDSVRQHAEIKKIYGYVGRKEAGAFHKYDNPDCPVYFQLQDRLKILKHGYSKATDQLTREIRFNRMSREKAFKLETKYINRNIFQYENFANWLGASEAAIQNVLLMHDSNLAKTILETENMTHKRKIPFKLGSFNNSVFIDEDFTNIGKGI